MNKKVLIIIVLFLFVILVGCEDTIQDTEYTIKFDSNSSLTYQDIVIKNASTINLPTPEKKGYIFKGWYPSEDFLAGTEVTNETTISKNITLHAKWQPKRIKVTYDLNGGNLKDEQENFKYIYTDENLILDRAYLDNHIFVGWFIGDNQIDNNYEYLEDTTITAKYISLTELKPQYSLTLNFNGGSHYDYYHTQYKGGYWHLYSNSVDWSLMCLYSNFINDFMTFINGKGPYESFYKASESRLIGYNGFLGDEKYFNKWIWLFEYLVTVASEENKPYIQKLIDGEYSGGADTYGIDQIAIRTELNAFFMATKEERVEKGITFTSADYSKSENLYGFIELLNPTEYVTGQGIILLSPKKDGFTFEGWYENEDFSGNKVTEILHNDHRDITLYAKWS